MPRRAKGVMILHLRQRTVVAFAGSPHLANEFVTSARASPAEAFSTDGCDPADARPKRLWTAGRREATLRHREKDVEDVAHADAFLQPRRLLDGIAYHAGGKWGAIRGAAGAARQGRAQDGLLSQDQSARQGAGAQAR